MKTQHLLTSIFTFTAVVAGCLLLGACEHNENTADTDENGRDAQDPSEFRIFPDYINLQTDTIQLKVLGGKPPFDWTVTNPGLGTISGSNEFARTVGYTVTTPAPSNGVNTVQVTDRSGRFKIATIVHD